MTQPLSALEAELTDLVTPGLSTLTRNQRLAVEELERPSCRRCGIPRSEYSGHWCSDGVTELWLGWAS